MNSADAQFDPKAALELQKRETVDHFAGEMRDAGCSEAAIAAATSEIHGAIDAASYAMTVSGLGFDETQTLLSSRLNAIFNKYEDEYEVENE